MRRVIIFTIIGASLIAAIIALRKTAAPVVWQVADVQPIDAPAAATGSAQPQLSVQGDTLLLSWIELINADATLKFAERNDDRMVGGAEGVSRPRLVRELGRRAVRRAARRRIPRRSLAAGKRGQPATPTTSASRFRETTANRGRRRRLPHHDGTPTEHGFASLFQAPGAGLGLVWLDGRAMKAAKPDEEPSGSMGLRAAVFDRQGAQVSETVVDDRVCECCPTAVAVTSEGPIVAFRDRSQDEIRDIYVSRLC